MTDNNNAPELRFAEWFRKNYPGPDTIIHDPDWHAPKIFRAAIHAARADLCAADRGVTETCPDCKGLGRWGFADGGDTCEQCSGRGTIAALQPTEAQSVDRGSVSTIVSDAVDALWPIFGGNHQPTEFWIALTGLMQRVVNSDDPVSVLATTPTDSTSLVSGVQRYKPNGFGMVPSLDGVWVDYRDVVALARREASPVVTVGDCIKAVEALTPTRFNIGGPQLINRKGVIAALRALGGSN